VANIDLFVPGLNFVFGDADRQRGVAVMSFQRVGGDDDMFVRRAASEAIHELGHAYGLDHCRNARCVMWFSNTLAETDRKGTSFCLSHEDELSRAS
jgi:archaemetzincin